ncbi:hypothetical protein D9M69_677790 [compost metagenome]
MASRVRVLMVKPIRLIRAKAPISDTGMVTSGIRVARSERRKMKIIRMTSATASQMVMKTLSMDSRMNSELSWAMAISMPSGSSARTSGRAALKPSEISRGLAVACLITPMDTAGRPL